MILFGQSAGGSSVDKYSYAWKNDPLVKGFIMMSGQGEISGDPTDHSNFTFMANQLGCPYDKDAQLRCMQSKDARDIIDVLNNYDSAANGGQILNFQPQADNETSFTNYTDLQVRGLFAQMVRRTLKDEVEQSLTALYSQPSSEPPTMNGRLFINHSTPQVPTRR